MKLKVYSDELYPCAFVGEATGTHNVYEVPDDLAAKWLQKQKEFNEFQDEVLKFLGEGEVEDEYVQRLQVLELWLRPLREKGGIVTNDENDSLKHKTQLVSLVLLWVGVALIVFSLVSGNRAAFPLGVVVYMCAMIPFLFFVSRQ